MDKHEGSSTVTLGFWIYLMTDLLMFAVLFATFAVLRDSSYGGTTIREIFNPLFILIETLLLLTSSFTCGLAMLAAHAKDKSKTLGLFAGTFLLGLIFLAMEFYEFSHLISEGSTPQRSAFLSSYFTLVGTHGLHILAGLFWMGLLIVYMVRRGVTESAVRKLTLLSLFWHFLDIVWIFIFTIVYLFAGIL